MKTYQDVCRRSAEEHLAHLESELSRVHAAAPRQLAKALIETTRNALAQGPLLSPGAVSLRIGLVNAAMSNDVNAADTARFLNQSSLGLGCRTPAVVFVGKEAAFDAKRAPANFLLESLALSILWLCDASETVMRGLLETPNVNGVRFLQFPWTVCAGTYQRHRPPDHTWNVIDRVLGRAGLKTWSESAYLVELGVVPSKVHKGQRPTLQRVDFLAEMARVFARTGCRNLVFHGREDAHASAQESIGAAFLDIPIATLANSQTAGLAKPKIDVWEANERRIIRCRHLSNLFGDESVVGAVADRLLR